MKLPHTLIALASAWISVTALAAGAHSGGHGHGHGTSAIGEAGKASEVTRTIQVDMLDSMRFSPASFAVKRGETIRFAVRNTGRLKHEFVLGTQRDLDEHYEVMKKFPEMEHAEDNMLSLAPGKSGELIWKFTKAGTVKAACLHPGHYDAGMKADIRVAPAKAASK